MAPHSPRSMNLGALWLTVERRAHRSRRRGRLWKVAERGWSGSLWGDRESEARPSAHRASTLRGMEGCSDVGAGFLRSRFEPGIRPDWPHSTWGSVHEGCFRAREAFPLLRPPHPARAVP